MQRQGDLFEWEDSPVYSVSSSPVKTSHSDTLSQKEKEKKEKTHRKDVHSKHPKADRIVQTGN